MRGLALLDSLPHPESLILFTKYFGAELCRALCVMLAVFQLNPSFEWESVEGSM